MRLLKNESDNWYGFLTARSRPPPEAIQTTLRSAYREANGKAKGWEGLAGTPAHIANRKSSISRIGRGLVGEWPDHSV